jgi:predicted nucleotidyltransferase
MAESALHLPAGTVADNLAAYRGGRQALLARASEMLQRDKRVVAAWQFGSLGRGAGDDLSDLDLFVVVADEHLKEIVAERRAFASRLGDPVLLREAPENAPPHGAYLMALYPGEHGPYQVDWYWQEQTVARIPPDTTLLFDRAGLPRADCPATWDYQPTPEVTAAEAASQDVNFFWVMLLITAKYAARSSREDRMGLLRWALVGMAGARRFAGITDALPPDDETPCPDPAEKMQILRRLAAMGNDLMPQVAARGATVPTGIIEQAERYLNLIEQIMLGRTP